MEELLQHLFDKAQKHGAEGFEAMVTLDSGVMPGAVRPGPTEGVWEIRTKMSKGTGEVVDVDVFFLSKNVKAITQEIEASRILQPVPPSFNSLIRK